MKFITCGRGASGMGLPRVLHVGPVPPPWGGVASNLRLLVDSPALAAFEMAVLNTARDSNREDVSPDKQLWHIDRFTRGLRMVRDAWRAIRSFRPAIVHIQSGGPDLSILRDLLFIPIARRLGCAVIFHQQFWPDPATLRVPTPLYRWMYGRYASQCAAVLMPTPVHVQQAVGLVHTESVHCLPNTCNPPIDLACCDASRQEVVTAVYVGRLSDLKGTYHLLEAIDALKTNDVPLRFVLVGIGATADDDRRVSEYIATRGLSGVVTLAGQVSNDKIWPLLSSAQLLVFPSLTEMFPVALVEGLAAGLPIITTDVDYLPRLVVHDENGLIVPPASPKALAAAIRQLAASPEVRTRMSRANRAKFEAEFSIGMVSGRLRSIYDRILYHES